MLFNGALIWALVVLQDVKGWILYRDIDELPREIYERKPHRQYSCFPWIFNPGCPMNKWIDWEIVCRTNTLGWEHCDYLEEIEKNKRKPLITSEDNDLIFSDEDPTDIIIIQNVFLANNSDKPFVHKSEVFSEPIVIEEIDEIDSSDIYSDGGHPDDHAPVSLLEENNPTTMKSQSKLIGNIDFQTSWNITPIQINASAGLSEEILQSINSTIDAVNEISHIVSETIAQTLTNSSLSLISHSPSINITSTTVEPAEIISVNPSNVSVLLNSSSSFEPNMPFNFSLIKNEPIKPEIITIKPFQFTPIIKVQYPAQILTNEKNLPTTEMNEDPTASSFDFIEELFGEDETESGTTMKTEGAYEDFTASVLLDDFFSENEDSQYLAL